VMQSRELKEEQSFVFMKLSFRRRSVLNLPALRVTHRAKQSKAKQRADHAIYSAMSCYIQMR
jgi:hypothetical protein